MAAADEAEYFHAGGARGGHARDAVLDDEAVFGGRAHRARREQEEVGMGLAARNFGGGEDVRGEEGFVARHAQREAQPLGRAR